MAHGHVAKALTAWIAIALSTGGCAVAVEDELGSDQQNISGGTLAVDGEFEPVINWAAANTSCTGTKISARRFLTAAHCLEFAGLAPNDVVVVNNGLLGVGGPNNLFLRVTAVHSHPSWEFSPPIPTTDPNLPSRDSHRVFDVGLFDVAIDTPDIPAMALSSDYFGDGSPWFQLAGYGCDEVTPSENGRKQYASFAVAWESYWYDSLSLTEDWEVGSFTHHITGWTDDSDDACSGDSGGPYMLWRNNRWEVIGVLHQRFNNGDGDLAPFQLGSRVGNVYNWILNPGRNDFSNNSRGTLINTKSGKCAGVGGGSTEVGAEVFQFHCDGRRQLSDNQFWTLVDRGDGWFQLRNGRSGHCLSDIDSQLGDEVAQFACGNATNHHQQWRFEDNTEGVFRVRNRARNTCLGVGGGSTDNGAPMGVWTCAGSGRGVNQSWVFSR